MKLVGWKGDRAELEGEFKLKVAAKESSSDDEKRNLASIELLKVNSRSFRVLEL